MLRNKQRQFAAWRWKRNKPDHQVILSKHFSFVCSAICVAHSIESPIQQYFCMSSQPSPTFHLKPFLSGRRERSRSMCERETDMDEARAYCLCLCMYVCTCACACVCVRSFSRGPSPPIISHVGLLTIVFCVVCFADPPLPITLYLVAILQLHLADKFVRWLWKILMRARQTYRK